MGKGSPSDPSAKGKKVTFFTSSHEPGHRLQSNCSALCFSSDASLTRYLNETEGLQATHKRKSGF